MIDLETIHKLHEICPDLAAQIAKCTEQAYRRGYQHGGLYGHGLDREVCNWRFAWPKAVDPREHPAGDEYSVAIAPPDRRDLGLHPGLKKTRKGETYGYTCIALKRLSMEASNCSELIQRLVEDEIKRAVPFGTWLGRYTEAGPIGDLKDDFLRDCRVLGIPPAVFKAPADVCRRLEANGACSEAFEALSEAAELFETSRPDPGEGIR